MTSNTEIIESLTAGARTALLGTIGEVHPSYGFAALNELQYYGLTSLGILTNLGRRVRAALLDASLDEAFGPDPRDELVAAVLAWDKNGDDRALVDAIITYRRAVKR